MPTTAATRALIRQLARTVDRLETERRETALLTRLRQDPANLMALAGISPDPWQAHLLRSTSARTLLLCSRQSGKSTVAGALALKTALLSAGSLVLLLSPTQRQSGELFRAHVKRLYNALGRPVATVQESALTMEPANGSRIVSLPGKEGTVRVYSSVALLVLDESARIADDLYRAVRPMLAVSRGRLIGLSTPFGQRGWFHENWTGHDRFERVKITARQCPRIDPAFLREEEQALGPRWFRQEYLCSFEDIIGAVFPADLIDSMFTGDVKPLAFLES